MYRLISEEEREDSFWETIEDVANKLFLIPCLPEGLLSLVRKRGRGGEREREGGERERERERGEREREGEREGGEREREGERETERERGGDGEKREVRTNIK